MIVALDVLYGEGGSAVVGAVGFERFDSEKPCWEASLEMEGCLPYEPGSFHKRELPCLMAALALAPRAVSCVVVDGYVDLDEHGRPGLGRRLWEALGEGVAVVGVAKTAFAGAPPAWGLLRGASSKPLFVTAVGMGLPEARAAVASMAGGHRAPTMLKRVDAISRDPALANSPKAPGGPRPPEEAIAKERPRAAVWPTGPRGEPN